MADLSHVKAEVPAEGNPSAGTSAAEAGLYDSLIEDLLERACLIVDVLPEQVPGDSPGQYFAIEDYYLQPERLRILRRRFAEILLRLNCYSDMAVSSDNGESWEKNPDPEVFAGRLEDLPGNGFLRVIFEAERAMADLDGCDINMTFYGPESQLTQRLRQLAAAEGLFVWSPPDT